MQYEQPWIEHREHARVNVRGAITLQSAGLTVQGTAVNVSATTLEVQIAHGLVLAMADAPVEIQMRLNGSEGSWFAISGRVRRVHSPTNSLVITMDAVPAPLRTWIAEQTGNTQPPLVEVMVVDADTVRRIVLAAAFRAEGCHVLEAATALEAFDELEGAAFTTDVFAVGDTEPAHIGNDLRDHLDGAYIDALVIGVGDPEWTPTRMRLEPNDVPGSLQGKIHALLLARAEDRHDALEATQVADDADDTDDTDDTNETNETSRTTSVH